MVEEVHRMTSVPIGFWPDNLSSLACVGAIILIFIADIITYEYATIGIMIMMVIFCTDQLILGPMWYYKKD